MSNAYEVIPQQLSIRAMRSSGYKDAAHAIAELIDNSIQAAEGSGKPAEVEVICLDRVDLIDQRRSRRIAALGVLDNACGMDKELLRGALQFGYGSRLNPDDQTGIGKFGMGLPNSSISQCRKVDVWSWQSHEYLHTYLDVREIENGSQTAVPVPTKRALPKEWTRFFRQRIGPSGTFVLWTDLDRITWKRSPAFLRHTEFLAGRIYRYYIHQGKASIRLASFLEENGAITADFDADVRPNDPLFLMDRSCSPSPYDTQAAFDKFGEETISVAHAGATHEVRIRYSIAKPEIRQEGKGDAGHSPIGQHVKQDQGVSVVRAGRELELNRSFENAYDPRERWWGVEISFQPGLDDVFGVTNNKQSATAFKLMDLEADAHAEGMSTTEYLESLQESHDPRILIYRISERITKTLSTIRTQIQKQREGARSKLRGVPGNDSAEGISTRVVRERQEQGLKGLSDAEEAMNPEMRTKQLTETLEEAGVEHAAASELAVEYVKSNLKFLFRKADLPSAMMFDVASRAGSIILTINLKHPISANLFDLLDDSSNPEKEETKELIALKLLLSSWARMEDEATDSQREKLEDVRVDWGRIARDFISAMN